MFSSSFNSFLISSSSLNFIFTKSQFSEKICTYDSSFFNALSIRPNLLNFSLLSVRLLWNLSISSSILEILLFSTGCKGSVSLTIESILPRMRGVLISELPKLLLLLLLVNNGLLLICPKILFFYPFSCSSGIVPFSVSIS